MISIAKLSEILSDDIEKIEFLLNEAGFDNIHTNHSRGEIRFSYDVDSNPTSSVVYANNLNFYSFSHNKSGNLFSLIMDKLHLNFPETLKWVTDKADIKDVYEYKQEEIKLPFGGFYKEISQQKEIPEELSLKTYPESILEPYKDKFNLKFFKDGISYQTQNHFNVGYDHISNRITIPEYNVNGEIVGIMGRLNKKPEEMKDYDMRWLPLIPCSRGKILYGFHQNYKPISENNMLFIGESEKFVMQLNSMGIATSLALGTCNITDIQAKYIKSLQSKYIILCFDEGLEKEHSIEMARKLLSNNFLYKNKVGYVFDENNIYLPKGCKDAPSDFGKGVFEKLVRNKVEWIN